MSRPSYAYMAFAVGAGVAAGFASLIGRRRIAPLQPRRNHLEPLLERLDRIEARVSLAEETGLPGLSKTFAAHAQQLELLRQSAAEGKRLAATEIRRSEERFQEFKATLPTALDALVAPRVENLRERLRMEMEESVAKTLRTFEQSLSDRVSTRIEAVEQCLVGQSEALADLRHRASVADQNLQKLVNAMEKLFLQGEIKVTPPPAQLLPPAPFTERQPDLSFAPGTEQPRRNRVALAQAVLAAASIFIGTRYLR